jgi:hypothetical protein
MSTTYKHIGGLPFPLLTSDPTMLRCRACLRLIVA